MRPLASLGLGASVVRILRSFRRWRGAMSPPMRITQRCSAQAVVHPIALDRPKAAIEAGQTKCYLPYPMEFATMAQQGSKRPTAAGANRGRKTVARTTRSPKASHATLSGLDTKSGGPISRVAPQATIEDRLEAKAARGDRAVYTGPSLDEMSREQRHKLLYGE
jgi:hypothetical protein